MQLHTEIGNVAVRQKNGVFDHPVVIMPDGYVYENIPDNGEGLTLQSDFLSKSGGNYTIYRYTSQQRQQHVAHAIQQLATRRSWSPLNN